MAAQHANCDKSGIYDLLKDAYFKPICDIYEHLGKWPSFDCNVVLWACSCVSWRRKFIEPNVLHNTYFRRCWWCFFSFLIVSWIIGQTQWRIVFLMNFTLPRLGSYFSRLFVYQISNIWHIDTDNLTQKEWKVTSVDGEQKFELYRGRNKVKNTHSINVAVVVHAHRRPIHFSMLSSICYFGSSIWLGSKKSFFNNLEIHTNWL